MKKLGDLNFELEDIIEEMESCNRGWREIISTFSHSLKKFQNNQEEYLDGSNPKLILIRNNRKLKITPLKNEKVQNLVRAYVKDHDLQWGEVLYIVYGYLMIHSPQSKDIDSFYYGP
tara:strand:- start:4025 stop:4375 length:351 start_codon:yes stop_codon:yes gene_type:complete